MKNRHIIQGKWVDCKSAIPINEMKKIQMNQEVRLNNQYAAASLPEYFNPEMNNRAR